MRWAVIKNGLVVNVVLWDGVSEWGHGADDVRSLEAPGLEAVGIGWTWDVATADLPSPPAEEAA